MDDTPVERLKFAWDKHSSTKVTGRLLETKGFEWIDWGLGNDGMLVLIMSFSGKQLKVWIREEILETCKKF